MNVVAEIKTRVNLRGAAAMLGVELPKGIGRKFRSPFRSDRNPSCTLYEHKGETRFRDWSADLDLDAIGLFAHGRAISNGDAIRELARKLRIKSKDCIAESDRRDTDGQSIQNAAKVSPSPKPMPRQVANAWIEGTNYLANQARLQLQIAEWRGWTPALIAQLAADGMMGTPLFRGERLVAFRVDFPVMKDFGPFGTWFSTIQVGWHVRLKPKPGKKAEWRFVPNEVEHGHSTPALPFVLGDFQSARLLVVMEGQFDCITFAHAAGWLSYDAAWPDWICVLGLRGANGVNPFLSHYAALWPKEAKCWLLPDDDAAGRAWFKTGNGETSFAERLSALCDEVHVETITGAKDFNQAWQRDLVKQGDIGRRLQINGFTNNRGRVR